MPLWRKEDKPSARPKSVQLKSDGTLAQDASGKKLVYLSKEEAQANANKGASGAGWYTVLTINGRTQLEQLVAISNEERSELNNAQVIETHLLNTNALVFSNGAPGILDPNDRSGWYFKNDSAGKKINWYFFDGQAVNVALGNFSAYAIVTLDSVTSRPFLVLYSMPTGSGDAVPGFYKSSRVFTWPAGAVAGTKYLIYFGQNPTVHAELPRVQLVAGTTNGSFASSERVFSVALHSDSGSSVNNVQFIVETLGINATTVKADIELRLDSSDNLEDSSGLS
jgi:hypothetical protein